MRQKQPHEAVMLVFNCQQCKKEDAVVINKKDYDDWNLKQLPPPTDPLWKRQFECECGKKKSNSMHIYGNEKNV